MSKIIRLQALGGPETLKIEELPVPEPGAGEVRIDVAAIGLNRVEAMFRRGDFGTPALPSKIGYEAAGVINAVGDGVSGFAVGDRVAVLPGLSMETYGTYGEQILYPADMLVAVPDEQTLLDAAATWMQYLTAYGLIAVGNISRGDTVVITAASSSVGLAAIQIANAVGAVPIATTRSADKVDRLSELGAAHVINTETQDVTRAILDITGDRGASLVFDAVAGNGLIALLNALSPKGTAILYGALAGNRVDLSLQSLMLFGLRIQGFAANHLLQDPGMKAAAIAFIREGLASKHLQPVIDRVFKFDAISEAHRYLESNVQLGKIVVATGIEV